MAGPTRLRGVGDGPGAGDAPQAAACGSAGRAAARRPRDGAVRALWPGDRVQPGAGAAERGGGGTLLSRLFQRGPLAAVPRPARQLPVQPGKLADLCRGQPALRRGGRRGDRPGRFHLGPRLPAHPGRLPPAASWGSGQRSAYFPAHPLSFPGPVPPPALEGARFMRGPAGIRSDRLSDPARPAQLRRQRHHPDAPRWR